MKRVALIAILALAACDQQQGGAPVIRQDISGDKVVDIGGEEATGPAGQSAAFSSDCTPHFFDQVLLTDCVADPAKHAITTALGPEGGAPFRSLKSYSETVVKDSVAFAMNAGMFDGDGKPIGYYVEESNRLNELNRADGEGNFYSTPNGVFYGSGNRWAVLATQSFYTNVLDRPEFGTQSGPMLVVDGELHPDIKENGEAKAIRNGVGVDDEGRAHFVISEAPVSFGVLARFFRDELKIDNALYLDGNVSALWDPAKGRIDGGAPIGPLIVVTKKQTAPAESPAP